MRTEKRDVYICCYCGKVFTDKLECREHEINCRDGIEVVYITLCRNAEGRFVFDCTLKKVTRYTYAIYDTVEGWDEECDYFVTVSNDTSDGHIKELKEMLLKKAIEEAKKYRDERNQYYGELLKELDAINKKEENSENEK